MIWLEAFVLFRNSDWLSYWSWEAWKEQSDFFLYIIVIKKWYKKSPMAHGKFVSIIEKDPVALPV